MNNRQRRHFKIRKNVIGTVDVPRLSVFRSNTRIYAQIIDDKKGVTLAADSDIKMDTKMNKVNRAYEVGKRLAAIAVKKGITKVVFDRGGFLYHGRVAKLAEGAREGGLKF